MREIALQFVHFPLNDTIVVRQGETGEYGCFVLLDALDQWLQFGDLTSFHLAEPVVKVFALTVANHPQKILGETIHHVSSRTGLTNGG
jgi:hypothetical protein